MKQIIGDGIFNDLPFCVLDSNVVDLPVCS